MRKRMTRSLALTLALVLAFCFASPALAAWEDFSDVSGHWAEETLRRAFDDELVAGFEDATLRPDEPITTAQMITVLCRVLGVGSSGLDYASVGLTGEEWYADAAAGAVLLGLISSLDGVTEPMTRGSALTMLARAFQLVPAEPDYTVLDAYADGASLSGRERGAMAALVSQGYVEGYGGSLNVSGSISRAEFFAVLYRVAGNYSDAPAVLSGGSVFGSVSSVRDAAFTDGVWLDCSTSGVTLQNVKAPLLVLRSKSLSYVNLYGTNVIDRLVLASQSAAGVTVTPYGSGSVDTLVVGDNRGSVATGGNIRRVEVTGDSRAVTVTSKLDELVVSGSLNSITINPGVTVGSVRVLSGAVQNKITINGSVTALSDYGGEGEFTGYGRVTDADINSASGPSLTVNVTNTTDRRDLGIEGLEMSVAAQETLPAGETLKATASFTVPESAVGKNVAVAWSIDNIAVSSSELTLGEGATAEFSFDMEYTRELPESCVVSCVVSYTTEQDEAQSVSAEAAVALENYGEEYYEKYDAEAVLAEVKTGYKGNYTLQWALDNDYDDFTKRVWVNAKGYSSSTNYLIWVSLAYQRVNIFEGKKGEWELLHEYLCGSGAPGSGTPVGVYTVFGRQTGWFTGTYTCRPIVNFKTGSGYAFHSRLYYPGWSEEFTDARIGFPVSHGCLRMYTEDVTWMYDNIPTGTTVVVF